ncbi:unnamed protein product, partial [Ectocarpus sp. 12 AP-2014]
TAAGGPGTTSARGAIWASDRAVDSCCGFCRLCERKGAGRGLSALLLLRQWWWWGVARPLRRRPCLWAILRCLIFLLPFFFALFIQNQGWDLLTRRLGARLRWFFADTKEYALWLLSFAMSRPIGSTGKFFPVLGVGGCVE